MLDLFKVSLLREVIKVEGGEFTWLLVREIHWGVRLVGLLRALGHRVAETTTLEATTC